MTEDGKQIFRDEKGYPKAVFDPATKTWLTPEQADVNVTWEKFKAMYSGYSYVGDDGKTYRGDWFLDSSTKMIDPIETESKPNGTQFIIFNPSGEISVWGSQKETAQRQREGATVFIVKSTSYAGAIGVISMGVAFDQYQKGNLSIFVTYNDFGVTDGEIKGIRAPSYPINIGGNLGIPKITDASGRILSPVLRMPKHLIIVTNDNVMPAQITNPDFWLDEVINAGAYKIVARNVIE